MGDADLLNKFKVTNCKQVLHAMVHFVLAAACEYDVTMSAQGSCKPFSGAGCKTAVDTAVQKFPEGDTSQSDSNAEGPAEAEGTEALLGLVKQCSAVVKTAIASDSVQKIHAQNCDVHVDKNAMSIMQVDADHCEEYLEQQMTEIGTISCVAAAVTRDDAPQSEDAVTSDWMESHQRVWREVVARFLWHRRTRLQQNVAPAPVPRNAANEMAWEAQSVVPRLRHGSLGCIRACIGCSARGGLASPFPLPVSAAGQANPR